MVEVPANVQSGLGGRRTGKNGLLRARQMIGKYRITGRLGEGGFAMVYSAMDTIEGLAVALKIPHEVFISPDVMAEFRREVRLTARLDHPGILRIKDASIVDDRLVIAVPLAERTLHDRLRCRMSLEKALDYSGQILEAVAYAHRMRVIHCDLKPENILIFPVDQLRLADFGIAKVAQKTVRGDGTGTVGYMAPEQAMGRPSLRSDVFSVGLMMYRMFSGHWPEWPYEWPCRGHHRLRGRVHREMIELVKKAIDPNPRKRFRDADRMLSAFQKIHEKTVRHARRQSRSSASTRKTARKRTTRRAR